MEQHLFSPLSVEKPDLRKSFSLSLLLRNQGSFFSTPLSFTVVFLSSKPGPDLPFSPLPKRCTDGIKELLCRPHSSASSSVQTHRFLGRTECSVKPRGLGRTRRVLITGQTLSSSPALVPCSFSLFLFFPSVKPHIERLYKNACNFFY